MRPKLNNRHQLSKSSMLPPLLKQQASAAYNHSQPTEEEILQNVCSKMLECLKPEQKAGLLVFIYSSLNQTA